MISLKIEFLVIFYLLGRLVLSYSFLQLTNESNQLKCLPLWIYPQYNELNYHEVDLPQVPLVTPNSERNELAPVAGGTSF